MTGARGGSAERLLLSGAVGPGQLADIRGRVSRCAATAGLTGDLQSDFVVAVNEALTNVVRHGGGRGTLRLWRDGDLICEVADHGPGFNAERYAFPTARPTPTGSGGMGLWLVRRLSPDAEIHSGPEGTTIRIIAPLPAGHLRDAC